MALYPTSTFPGEASPSVLERNIELSDPLKRSFWTKWPHLRGATTIEAEIT